MRPRPPAVLRRRAVAVLAVGGLAALTGLGGCEAGDSGMSSYALVIDTSISPAPVSFAGSYQYLSGGRRINRDLDAAGMFSESFLADELVYVRLSATSRDGYYSLRITRDGEMLFESSAVPVSEPIIYSVE